MGTGVHGQALQGSWVRVTLSSPESSLRPEPRPLPFGAWMSSSAVSLRRAPGRAEGLRPQRSLRQEGKEGKEVSSQHPLATSERQDNVLIGPGWVAFPGEALRGHPLLGQKGLERRAVPSEDWFP